MTSPTEDQILQKLKDIDAHVVHSPDNIQLPRWLLTALFAFLLTTTTGAAAWMIDMNGEIREIRVQMTDIFERRMDSQSTRIGELKDDLDDLEEQVRFLHGDRN